MVGHIFGDELEFIIPAAMITAFGLAVFQSFTQTHPHALRARQALDHYESVPGNIRITVESDDDGYVYTAGVKDRAGNDWMFRFQPGEWKPKAGEHPAELRYIDEVAWPVLIVTDAGILYPQFDPKQERLALPGEEAEGSSSPKGRILLGVVLIVAAVGWSFILWNMHRLDARIGDSGVVVEAEVVKVGHLRAKRDENHGLVYRFTLPDGRKIQRTWSEEEGRWKAYRPGDRILVRYHPEDPERQLIENRVGTSLSMMLLFIAMGGLPLVGFGLALVVSGMRRLTRKT